MSRNIVEQLRDRHSAVGRSNGDWFILLNAANEIERLEAELDRTSLRCIELSNPGINMDDVKYFRKHGKMPPKEEFDVRNSNVTQPS